MSKIDTKPIMLPLTRHSIFERRPPVTGIPVFPGGAAGYRNLDVFANLSNRLLPGPIVSVVYQLLFQRAQKLSMGHCQSRSLCRSSRLPG